MNKKARECYERKSEKHASVFKFYAVSSEIFEMVGGVFFYLVRNLLFNDKSDVSIMSYYV